jgi:hypothetical protein
MGGRFHVSEASSWKTALWDAPGGCTVAAAAWAPSGRALLVAFGGGGGSGGDASGGGGGGGGVVGIHCVSAPPSLVEQVLPVTLPEVTGLDRLGPGPAPGGCISDLAWDPSGRRLAVVLAPPHPAAGLVALYQTDVAPVLHAHLIGFARPHAAPEGGGGGARGGSGGGGLPAALAFAQKLAKGGAVLSVMGGGGGSGVRVANIAMAV